MSYSAYAPVAEKTMAAIEQEALARFRITACHIRHRIGELSLGEASVLVVVRAPHRADAFDAARYAIDTLKRRAPIWKQEHYVSGESRYLEGVPLQPGD
jgi:molybdopterin synthase catalytic subunit